MPRILPALFSLFLSVSVASANEPVPQNGHLGYLDGSGLLAGKSAKWKEKLESLARLEFDYVGTTGPKPSLEVAAYLEELELAVRYVEIPGQSGTESAVGEALRVLVENEQKAWLLNTPDIPEGRKLLWSDDGHGGISNWPTDKREFEIGVFLHAGSPGNGPVQDPYPERIGETLARAAERGMAGNVLVAAPSFAEFELNLAAAAAARNDPSGFKAEEFFENWASRRYGDAAGALAVKSLKLLHASHETFGGFAALTERSNALVRDLQNGGTPALDRSTVTQALDYAERAVELAVLGATKVSRDDAGLFDREILLPPDLMLRNIQLLDSLSELGNASKIHRDFPESDIAKKRFEKLSEQSIAAARALRQLLDDNTGLSAVPSTPVESVESLVKTLGGG